MDQALVSPPAITILGSQPQQQAPKSFARSFVDDYISLDEGREPHKSIEDYSITGAFGMKKKQRDRYPNLTDYEAAIAFTNDNIKEIQSQIGVQQWQSLPMGAKRMVSNLYYNAGSLFNTVKKELRDGDVMGAARGTLDVVSAKNKDTGIVGFMSGLANRRARNYNLAAKDLNQPVINSYTVKKISPKKTKVTYNLSNQEKLEYTVNKPISKLSLEDGTYSVINY